MTNFSSQRKVLARVIHRGESDGGLLGVCVGSKDTVGKGVLVG